MKYGEEKYVKLKTARACYFQFQISFNKDDVLNLQSLTVVICDINYSLFYIFYANFSVQQATHSHSSSNLKFQIQPYWKKVSTGVFI